MNSRTSTEGTPGSFRLPGVTLALTGLVVALHLLFGPAHPALVFDRSAIAAGEAWRLLTGHLVHADFEHIAWDAGALLCLGVLLERETGLTVRDHLSLVLFSALAVDLWLWWGMPGLERYCGFSAILNAQMAVLVLRGWRLTRSPLILLAGFGAVAKILAESLSGTALLTTIAWPSVSLAHGAGLVAGAVWHLLAVSGSGNQELTCTRHHLM